MGSQLKKKLERIYFKLKRQLRYIPKEERVNFSTHSIYDGHFSVKYRGVTMVRCPFDYVLYQMLISDIKPDLVIEIGTNMGGTALYIADLMDKIGHGTVHTIDIIDKPKDPITKHPRISFFTKGWDGYDIANAKNFSRIVVIEDASHMYEDSIGCLEKFSPLVSVGSYYIVEDSIVTKLGREKGFHGGPLRAIREFIASNNNFKIDRTYCDFFGKNATFNVNGYLKRIK